MKKSQKERIISKLLKDGYITRNECLRNYISRLGAIICLLKSEGWDFDTKSENGDYKYTVTKCPIKKVVYTVSGTGQKIETWG